MIAYLLKSCFCLAVTFGFYKVWLENEQMHVFKRFYLLGGLLFSLLIPLISLDNWFHPHSFVSETWRGYAVSRGRIHARLPTELYSASESPSAPYGLWLYWVVTMILVGRFIRNLYALIRKILRYSTHSFHGATLVELPDNESPYTFLHYFFVPTGIYRRGEMERELITHELTHIRQGHSLDVLFMELLICFGWFNPLLSWFKRAIQLNHEFIADEAVNQTYKDITQYQRLLLRKLTPAEPTLLTSMLTFQTTKQRFLMMTKHTTSARVWLTVLSTFLLVSLLTIFSVKTSSAQGKPAPTMTNETPSQNDLKTMEQLYGDKYVTIPSRIKTQKATYRKFSDLSAREKQQVQLIPPLPALVPTDAQLNDWKNSKKYGIWIDEKRVPNDQLNRFTVQDFGSYSSSKLEKNAINYGKHYFQIDLMTKPFYEHYLTESEKNPFLVLEDRKTRSK